MPSASTRISGPGGLTASGVATTVIGGRSAGVRGLEEAAVEHVGLSPVIRLRHDLGAHDLANARLLLLDGVVQRGEREILTFERSQPSANIGEHLATGV